MWRIKEPSTYLSPLRHPPGLLFCAPDCGASGIRSLEGGSVTVTGWCALDSHQRSLCMCWAHGLLCLCCAMCFLLSIFCLLPSCYQIIVSVAPPLSPSLPSFDSLFSLLVSVVLCWSVVFRPVCVMFDCVTVLFLAACFSPSGWFLFFFSFILLLKAHSSCTLSPRLISPHTSWQTVIREPQSCSWDRVICILLLLCNSDLIYTVSGGTCNVLSVF